LSDYLAHRDLPSFPTRRSSDLGQSLAEDRVQGEIYDTIVAERTKNPLQFIQKLSDATTYFGAVQAKAWGFIDVVIGNPVLRSGRSEEHTSELQSRENLVCRLLL